MLRGSGASRELWPVFRVAHFPAKRRDLLAQFVAPFLILFASYVLTLFCQLCHFVWNGDVGLSFKIKNSVDPFPPFQPCACRIRVHFVLIHRAIGFANRFEEKSQRSRNVEIVIQRVFQSSSWALGVGRWALGVCFFCNSSQPRQPLIDSS